MILVIGSDGCSRCKVTTNILTTNKISYDYVLFQHLSLEAQQKYSAMATAAKQATFPLIIKDEKLATLQEVIGQ